MLAALMLLPQLLCTLRLVAHANDFDDWYLQRVHPVTWLQREAVSGDASICRIARDVLLKRFDSLSDAQRQAVLAEAFEQYVRTRSDSDFYWEDLIQRAHNHGQLSANLWLKYARSMIPTAHFRVRTRIDDHSFLPLRVTFDPNRFRTDTKLNLHFIATLPHIDDLPLLVNRRDDNPYYIDDLLERRWQNPFEEQMFPWPPDMPFSYEPLYFDLQPVLPLLKQGKHRVTYPWRLLVCDDSDPTAPPLVRVDYNFQANFILLPHGQSSVKLITDAAADDLTRKACHFRYFAIDGKQLITAWDLDLRNNPGSFGIGVCFIVRGGGGSWNLGSHTCAGGQHSSPTALGDASSFSATLQTFDLC